MGGDIGMRWEGAIGLRWEETYRLD